MSWCWFRRKWFFLLLDHVNRQHDEGCVGLDFDLGFPAMLTILRLHLPSDIPIAGCELTPYILLRRPDGSITTDDIPDTSPVDGYYIRCRWWAGWLRVFRVLDIGCDRAWKTEARHWRVCTARDAEVIGLFPSFSWKWLSTVQRSRCMVLCKSQIVTCNVLCSILGSFPP